MFSYKILKTKTSDCGDPEFIAECLPLTESQPDDSLSRALERSIRKSRLATYRRLAARGKPLVWKEKNVR